MRVLRQARQKPTLFPFCLTLLALAVSDAASAEPVVPAVAAEGAGGTAVTGGAPSGVLRGPLLITPALGLTETYTDNVMLSPAAAAKSDFITQITPSLRVSSATGSMQGSLQAAFNGSFYGEDQSRNRGFLTMSGTGRVEVLKQRGFVDLNASVSQETLSAFAPKSSDSVTGTNNLGEVRTFSVAPYLVERFGDTGSAELRYLVSSTEVSGTNLKQTRNNALSFNVGNPAAFGNFGWYLAGSDSVMSTSGGRDLKQQSARLTGVARLTPQFQWRLIAGVEGNNIRSVDTQRSSIYGTSADWTPSPTTKLSALWEDRYFGPGMQFSAENRGPVHVVRLSYSKDVSSTSQSLSAFSAVGTYDLLMSLLQSSHPDAVERDVFVRQYMSAQGLPQYVGIGQAVLSNGLFLDRRLRFELSLIGVRNTLMFSAFHSERSNVTEQAFSVYGGDFQNASRVREISGSVILSRSLTPTTSANVGFTLANSSRDVNDATLGTSSRMRRVSAGLTTRVARGANGVFTLRNARGEGVSSYSENAAIASLLITF